MRGWINTHTHKKIDFKINLEEIYDFILQESIKQIKTNSKDFYIVTKNSIFKYMLLLWTFYSIKDCGENV